MPYCSTCWSSSRRTRVRGLGGQHAAPRLRLLCGLLCGAEAAMMGLSPNVQHRPYPFAEFEVCTGKVEDYVYGSS